MGGGALPVGLAARIMLADCGERAGHDEQGGNDEHGGGEADLEPARLPTEPRVVLGLGRQRGRRAPQLHIQAVQLGALPTDPLGRGFEPLGLALDGLPRGRP
ncbi:MAG: hypothetical protein M3O34_13025 [Chloroflexota bacterium]|nr:hypothetical protein [Chloroflexota bacterium]